MNKEDKIFNFYIDKLTIEMQSLTSHLIYHLKGNWIFDYSGVFVLPLLLSPCRILLKSEL